MRKKLYDEFVRDCGSSCMDEYIAWLEDRVFALEAKVEKFTSTNTAITKCHKAKECFPTIDRALRNS